MLLERLVIFVASPGDVAPEREHVKSIADELNRGIALQAGFVLDVVRWETHARPDMGRPQQLIMEQVGQCDIFIGIMWRRFGTPTGKAESGTEEEFEHALRTQNRLGQPRMLCYFSQAPIEPPADVDEATQLLKVAKFRARVNAAGLAWQYSSDRNFKELIREHLQQILVKEFAGRRPPLDRNLEALLDIEKERCQERNVAFMTPNLLKTILGIPTGPARRIFDRACPNVAENLLLKLRRYEPLDNDGNPRPFKNFHWYERTDVQIARRKAQQDGARVIDSRHLLLGFLDTDGMTRSAFRKIIGEDGFDRLIRIAETSDGDTGTPGIGDLL